MTDQCPQRPTEPGPDFQTDPHPRQPDPHVQPHPGQVPQGPAAHWQAQQPPVPPQQWQAQPPPHGYGMPPQPSPYATGPKRPGVATAAGVLGIVGGGLGFFVFLGTFAALAAIQDRVDAGYYGNLSVVMSILGNVQPFGVLATTVALLAAGITFLKKNGYTVLLVAACAQAILTVLGLVINFIDLNLSGAMRVDPSGTMGGFLVGITFRGVVGLALAGTIISLLSRPEAKQWGKRTS